jgi:hypothetical protein
VSNPSFKGSTVSTHVTTTQVAPSILRALNIPEFLLWSVLREGTTVLPGLSL